MLAQRMSNQSNADLIHYSNTLFYVNSSMKSKNININSKLRLLTIRDATAIRHVSVAHVELQIRRI